MKKRIFFIISLFRDIAITIGIIYFCYYDVTNYHKDSVNNMTDILNRTIFNIFAFVGIFEILDYLNWNFLIPTYYLKTQQIKLAQLMDEYYKKDYSFIDKYKQETTIFIMSQLGITQTQFNKINLELIKIRCASLTNLEEAKEKLRKYIKATEDIIIIDQGSDSTKYTYPHVRYYINLNEPMFYQKYADIPTNILTFLIQSNPRISECTKLIIPYDGNFLLGIEVGKKLQKGIIKMCKEHGRVEKERKWEGNLKQDDKVIIVHDVLVTGNQIIHAMQNIWNTCEVLGFYCLVIRAGQHGEENIKEHNNNITIGSIITLDDNQIATIKGN